MYLTVLSRIEPIVQKDGLNPEPPGELELAFLLLNMGLEYTA